MQVSEPTDDAMEIVDVLAGDFIARYRNGERPTVEEYANRHPEFSDSIRQMFPLVASIERIKINEQVAEDGSATLAGRVLSQLGDFRIVREIGRGGMGIVFEAHQESLERHVAIKVLPKQCLIDDEALKRFRREARTAAAMHHAHIVPIFGTGEFDGTHYLVMQLVQGNSLDSVVASGTGLPYNDAAKIGHQIADAIAYAHARGVIHRDIKPANVLIEQNGTAQVTDFGLAKNLNHDATNTQAVSGSLRYMAPERFAGVSNESGDVYAIGITLYELLAGRPAFEATDAEHLIGSITNAQLKPIQTLCPDIPTDLATIVTHATHVDPSQRYLSAADFRDDLSRFLSDEPIKARRTSAWGRFIRWVRRNPKLAAAVTTAVFALVAATIVSTIAFLVTVSANQRSVDALRASEETVDLALQSLDGVVDVVSQTPSSANLTLDGSFDDNDRLPDTNLDPSPASARILERLQPIYQRLSQQSPTRSDIVLRGIDSSIQLARIQDSLGRTSDGIDTLESSIKLLKQRGNVASISVHDQSLRLAKLNNELGDMFANDFNQEESIRCYEAAKTAAAKLDPTNSPGLIELARSHMNLGNRSRRLRRGESVTIEQREKDLQQVERAIEILQQLNDSQPPTKTTNILYANSLLAKSRLTQNLHSKRSDFQSAVLILRAQLNETPDDTAVRFELVQALADVNLRGRRSVRQYDEAARRLQEAIAEIKTLRSAHLDNALYLATEVHLQHKLSAIARTQSRYGDAERLLNEAIASQTLLIHTWPENVQHRCWRAMLYRSQATLYREVNQPAAEQAATASALADLDAVDPEFEDHPFVIRTREAISDSPSPQSD